MKVTMLRILFILLISILGMQCTPRPYQPNYNKHVSHNDVVKSRAKMVQKQANREIKRSNLQRKRARKDRSLKHIGKKAKRHSKKLVQ